MSLQATQHTNWEQLRTTTHREDEEQTNTTYRPRHKLFEAKDDRNPLNFGRDGPSEGTRKGHNSTHTTDIRKPSQPIERE